MRKSYETNWFNDIFVIWLVWEKCIIIESSKTIVKTIYSPFQHPSPHPQLIDTSLFLESNANRGLLKRSGGIVSSQSVPKRGELGSVQFQN